MLLAVYATNYAGLSRLKRTGATHWAYCERVTECSTDPSRPKRETGNERLTNTKGLWHEPMCVDMLSVPRQGGTSQNGPFPLAVPAC